MFGKNKIGIIMEVKKCTKCGEHLLVSEFYNRKQTKCGIKSMCKKCSHNHVAAHRLTKGGVVSRIYSSQKTHSALRNHPLPEYTRKELTQWLFSQSLFHELFDDWADSGYDRNLKPSVDRVFDDRGYSIDNIQLATTLANTRKQATLKRIGFKDDELKPVVAVSIGTGQIYEFISIRSASRETGVSRNGISACCHKKRIKDSKGYYYTPSSAGGYAWTFKESFNKDTFSFGNPYCIKQLRAVFSIDIGGNKIEYPSATEAARVTGISRGTILSCLNRKMRDGKNKGLQWNYKNSKYEEAIN